MPTFTMGCFKLPKSLCKDIESLIRKLWWGYKGEARKIHWIAWDKLCLPKCQGSLGFRDIKNFNLALLGKQVWRHVHNMESFYSIKSSKAKFFPNCSVLDSEVKLTGSYAWQSILKARTVVQWGSAWCIGDGRQVRIRGDKWLPDLHSSRILFPQTNLPNNALVCSLIDDDGPRWDEERVWSEFFPHEAVTILGVQFSSRQTPDTLIQTGTKSGRYLTKSACKILSEAPSSGPSNPSAQSRFQKNIWALAVPNKIKHFIWRACRELLPTKKNLYTRNVTQNSTCDLCQEAVEDVIVGCLTVWVQPTCLPCFVKAHL